MCMCMHMHMHMCMCMSHVMCHDICACACTCHMCMCMCMCEHFVNCMTNIRLGAQRPTLNSPTPCTKPQAIHFERACLFFVYCYYKKILLATHGRTEHPRSIRPCNTHSAGWQETPLSNCKMLRVSRDPRWDRSKAHLCRRAVRDE